MEPPHFSPPHLSLPPQGLGIIAKDGVERVSAPEVVGVYGKHLDTVGQLHIHIHSVFNSMHKTYVSPDQTPAWSGKFCTQFHLSLWRDCQLLAAGREGFI